MKKTTLGSRVGLFLLRLIFISAVGPRPCAWGLSAGELKVYSPVVDYGEREIEWRSFVSGKGADHESGHAMSVAYSPTWWWETEVYEVLHQNPGFPLVADQIELENNFAFSHPGEHWLDAGLSAEVELEQQAHNPNSFRLSPLFEKQFDSFLLTLNVPFEWKSGPNFVPGTDLSYAARVEYLWNPTFSPALESFGEPGVIGNWGPADSQTHLVGPAVYGQARWGQRQKLRYSVAGLRGLSSATNDWALVTRFEYEF